MVAYDRYRHPTENELHVRKQVTDKDKESSENYVLHFALQLCIDI